MKTWVVAVLCLGVLAGCQAARLQDAFLDMMPQDEGPQSLWSLLRERGGGGKREKEDKTAYAAIKFTVPPAEAKNFEDEWMNLYETTVKEEDVDKFTLSKTMLDNIIYWSYGEWNTMRDLRDHFFSKHFQDFSDFVDEHDIKWELRFFDNMSEDIERSQRKKTANFHKGNAHVLTFYYVPPGEAEGFIKAWTKTAERTIDEKGNWHYSLRKSSTDNTRFMVCGSWDSKEDFFDHFESKHLGKLHDYASDKEIYWRHELLEMINEEEEMGQK